MEMACSEKGAKKLLQAQAAACRIPTRREGPHQLGNEERDCWWERNPGFQGR